MAEDAARNETGPSSTAEPARGRVLAWQPFTARGVARFASGGNANLFFVELAFAMLLTGAVFWFVWRIWFPVIREAILQLPESGGVRGGVLQSQPLAIDGPFLGLIIEPEPSAQNTLGADIRIEFRRNRVRICSVFGCASYPYARQYNIELNRPEAEPWWGAWEPITLGIVALLVPSSLLLLWAVLATLYFPVASLSAFYADRKLTWSGSWRLASASLMPGTLLLAAVIVAYGFRAIDLIRLLVFAAAYIVVGWVYLFAGVYALPRIDSTITANPFSGTPPSSSRAAPGSARHNGTSRLATPP